MPRLNQPAIVYGFPRLLSMVIPMILLTLTPPTRTTPAIVYGVSCFLSQIVVPIQCPVSPSPAYTYLCQSQAHSKVPAKPFYPAHAQFGSAHTRATRPGRCLFRVYCTLVTPPQPVNYLLLNEGRIAPKAYPRHLPASGHLSTCLKAFPKP